jgi:L-phenylalanine/L-methionine N-acetyltransferase
VSTQPTLTLRRARIEDAEAFAALMNEPEVHAQLMQLPYADAETWRARLAANNAPGATDLSLVALADGRVVGSAGLHPTGPALRRRHAMMLGISVAIEWQGRGVGHALMGALCDYADHWLGLRRLELNVYTDNHRAIALYRKHGFEVEGLHRGYAMRNGVLTDSHSMARLRPGPPFMTP